MRRGDPLGLRGVHDRLAQRVAPGFTNRTIDARWLTLLGWSLLRSHEAWTRTTATDSNGPGTNRYAWLRPLELMWVARTLTLAERDTRGRQLPGRRRVSQWLNVDERNEPRFSMTEDRYRDYRQTGIYGSYRTLIRALPDMTRGSDGWTPGPLCVRLSEIVDRSLGISRVRFRGDEDRKIVRSWFGREDEWWLEQWPLFDQGTADLLPTKRSSVARVEEAAVLRGAIFGTDAGSTRRSKTAGVIGRSEASDHASLCHELADALASEPDGVILSNIPPLTRLGDAGIDMMDLLQGSLLDDRGPERPLAELSRRADIQDACVALAESARKWLAGRRLPLPHHESVDRFAAMVSSPKHEEVVTGLVHHHLEAGGGVRWFKYRDGAISPNGTPQRGASSRYGFRLGSLARIAAQVGETRRVPDFFREDTRDVVSEEDEAAP